MTYVGYIETPTGPYTMRAVEVEATGIHAAHAAVVTQCVGDEFVRGVVEAEPPCPCGATINGEPATTSQCGCTETAA